MLTVRLRLSGRLGALAVLDVFERLLGTFRITPSTWGASNSGDEDRLGGLGALRKYIASHESSIEFFSATRDQKVASPSADKRRGVWNVDIVVFEADVAWLELAVRALRDFAGMTELVDGEVMRGMPGHFELAPSPPIARCSHAVLTTDGQVIAAYDDPSVFWASWDAVADVNGRKLCTRALRALDEERWLGETFEGSMAMARAAKPKLTEYPLIQLTGIEGPWWDYGDVQDEKAGWPLLDLVGYDAKTKTVEYAAKPGHQGHVLLQELDTIVQLVGFRKTRDGKPVETVRVVFLDEAQARVEKRPLLDVGGRVYYTGSDGELVELTS